MIDQNVLAIAQKLQTSPRANLFESVLFALNDSLKADVSFVLKITPKGATSLFVIKDNNVFKDISFSLKDSAISPILNGEPLIIASNVQSSHPNCQCSALFNIYALMASPIFDEEHLVIGATVCGFYQEQKFSESTQCLFSLYTSMIRSEVEYQENNHQLQLANNIIENASEAIVIAAPDGVILHANQAFSQITGFKEEDIINTSIQQLFSSHQKDFSSWQDIKGPHDSNNTNNNWCGETWINRAGNHAFPAWLIINTLKNDSGHVSNIIAIFTDITEQKEAEEKIKFQENYDKLTQLANRSLFLDRINHAIEISCIEDKHFAILVIDLDNFNGINDTYGHFVGDNILIKMAQRLKKYAHSGNTVARIGGDEFAVLIENLESPDKAAHFASDILDVIHPPVEEDGQNFTLTASIGVSIYPSDGNRSESLLSHADQALHTAKHNRRDSFQFFTREMQTQAERRALIKNHLIHAIEHKKFYMMYQPIVSLETNRVEKFESLIRWDDNGESISPMEFIPVAEEFGLMKSIGEQVLQMSCQQLKEIHNKGYKNISMTINRSVTELPDEHSSFKDWMEVIEKHQLPPLAIEFEITESVLAPEHTDQVEYLNGLQNVGVKIAIDDFGTGYSSLSYLKRFSANVLKIDRSFIMQLEQNPDDKALVSTIINLARSLNLKVVAEGVETRQQLEILRALGCQYVQGYYISKPLRETETIRFLDIISIANLQKKIE